MDRIVRLTSDITFADLKNNHVTFEDAFLSQVKKWLIEPCEYLLNQQDTDFRMSAFAILLMFFETHGQYLGGKSSRGKSKKVFIISLRGFITFLQKRNLFLEVASDDFFDNFYEFARCGLFHSTSMCKYFLIDSVNFSNLPISRNPIHEGFLVNVYLFKNEIWEYAQDYIKNLKNTPRLKENFNRMFKILIFNPLEKYSS